jgi:hypothetical protein
MKKVPTKRPRTKVVRDGEMLPEYDFSGGVRGKYAAEFANGSNLILLDPDVAELFPDATAVNEALRALVAIARRQVGSPKSPPAGRKSATAARPRGRG